MDDIKKIQNDFMSLLEPVHANLSRFVRAMSRNREDARDTICETIMTAYENFGRLKSRDAFTSYLFSIASRLHKKKNWRKRLFGEYDEKEAEKIIYRGTSPETNLDIEFLYKSLRKLPEKVQEAIVLFEISGFSLEEIKEIQGGSLSGVKTRLKRGREKLARIMGAGGDGELKLKIDGKDESAVNESSFPNGAILRLYNKNLELNLKAGND